MPRSTAAALAVALVMVIGAAAVRASWDADDGDDGGVAATVTTTVAETTAPTTTPATPTSEGGGVTFTVTAVPASTTTTAPAASVGLPPSLAVPGPDVITLSGESTWSLAFTVTGVPEADVVAWVRAELAADGWQVEDAAPGIVRFTGPNAAGVALVSGDDPVAVAVQLSAP
ncbi:MAG TPA: hypothetical protein VGB14_05350 [Acidimicrobiales bacterium]